MIQRPATSQEQMNIVIGAVMSLMAVGGLFALLMSVARDPSPLNLSKGLVQLLLGRARDAS